MATVTILSTVKNIRETAAAWLEYIATQNYEGGFDIVIIDSASTDGTKEILDAYCARYPKMSAFLHESTQPEALNYALDRDLVSGELVALIDGDCVAPKNWLRGLVHVLKEKAVDAVGGPGLTSPDAHGLERIVGMDLDSRFLSHPGGLVKRLPNMNLLLRRDILNVVRFPESWPVAYDEVFGYELNNK